jgi:hypothetical protein
VGDHDPIPTPGTPTGTFRRRSLGPRAYTLIGGTIACVIAVLAVLIVLGNLGSHYTVTLAISAPGQSVSLVLTGNESAVRNASAQMTSATGAMTKSGLGVSIETLGGNQHRGAKVCQITGPGDGVQITVYSIDPGSATIICTEARKLWPANG